MVIGFLRTSTETPHLHGLKYGGQIPAGCESNRRTGDGCDVNSSSNEDEDEDDDDTQRERMDTTTSS